MRLLFIGNADNPLLVDLALELKRSRAGCVIDIISDRASRHPGAARAFDRVLVPEGGGRMRTTRGLKFLWFVARYRQLLSRLAGGYDAVHVFYLSAIWGVLANSLARKGRRVIVTVFGSDVYRATAWLRPWQRILLRRADRITASNADTLEAARRIAPIDPSRCGIVRFGLRPLDHIERLRSEGDRAHHKRAMGILPDRIVVVAGYNASPYQHHAAIIDALKELGVERTRDIEVLLPMTMGGDAAYIRHVEARMVASGLSHRLFTHLMTDEEVARLRLATDIMVQVQPTDQLAGAMQEHLAAGTVVLTGAWLPYGVLREAGVRFWTVNAREEVRDALVAAIDELPERTRQCGGNARCIHDLSSWSVTAPRWSALYDAPPGAGR